ncbi:MAG: hypothetical protein FWF23_02670 [Alphaproteobacteria bacterium]|nr:hypothetical protein [Alphaproteobacteria bacterium]MCL2505522.1 hypothetical protein [Alphaproteobacteria bacterium]
MKIALIATASVAAVKTAELAAVLSKDYSLNISFTRDAERFDFFPALKKKLSALIKNEIESSDVVLIAPATADFMYQLARGITEEVPANGLALSVISAFRKGAEIFIAPAMNYRMWQHPAVQANYDILLKSGVVFIGPDKGRMACGDEGYGRMTEPQEIAEFVNGKKPLEEQIKLKELWLKEIPFVPSKGKILYAIDESMPEEEIDKIAKNTNAHAIAIANSKEREKFLREKLLFPVTVRHYEIKGMNGLEHIKLPEQSSRFIFPFVSEKLRQDMLFGRADNLVLCAYLASKIPVEIR